jgi:Family of unknown function (DUF6134)
VNHRFCFAATVLLVTIVPLRAADVETRTFAVTIDGKQSGEFRLTMRTQDDGVRETTAESLTQPPRGLAWRRTNYNGIEVWKAGRLERLDARSVDDGRRRHLIATPNGNQLRLMINGQRSDVRGDVWTNTWWFVPPMSGSSRNVAVLEVESGKVVAARLERLGIVRLTVLGEPLDCAHFRLQGDSLLADLWFDGSDRIIRIDATEDKHRTMMELIKVQR